MAVRKHVCKFCAGLKLCRWVVHILSTLKKMSSKNLNESCKTHLYKNSVRVVCCGTMCCETVCAGKRQRAKNGAELIERHAGVCWQWLVGAVVWPESYAGKNVAKNMVALPQHARKCCTGLKVCKWVVHILSGVKDGREWQFPEGMRPHKHIIQNSLCKTHS